MAEEVLGTQLVIYAKLIELGNAVGIEPEIKLNKSLSKSTLTCI